MARSRSDAGVSVLIPAYRPAHLPRTLDSLAAQSLPATAVHVSLDYAPDFELSALPALAGLRVHRQAQRLGWVGNVNGLLARVDTPFFIVLAHDDCLSPEFLADCTAALRETPQAVVAHGQCLHYGIREGEVAFTEAIRGTPFARVMAFLDRGPHLAELGWRGVVRSSALEAGVHLRCARSDGQFSNTLWALELLTLGESIALQQVHYAKHTDPVLGLSRQFHRRGTAEKSRMLADNLACLVEVLAVRQFPPEERQLILSRYAQWLLELEGAWNELSDRAYFAQMAYSELRPAIAQFVANALLSLAAAGERGPAD
jgi:hypothetical protein